MIITRLVGGIGNQMFQYATGRALAHRLDTQLLLDVSHFQHTTDRHYDLGCFSIQEMLATQSDLDDIQTVADTTYKKYFKIFRSTFRGRKPIVRFKERYFHFDSSVLTLPDNTYIEGYWQSEKYFKEIEHVIRNEFHIKKPPDLLNKKIGNDILACEAVSIHVRRGDYVTNPITNRILGLCNSDYYNKSVEDIAQKLDRPVFFIFSDDPIWTKANLQLDYPRVYISHNGPERNYEDLRLMSMCQHNIVANSSFSWWGAWLNSHEHKNVYVPENWFRRAIMETKDLIPDSWIKVKNENYMN